MENVARPIAALLRSIATQTVTAVDVTSMHLPGPGVGRGAAVAGNVSAGEQLPRVRLGSATRLHIGRHGCPALHKVSLRQ